MHKYMCVSNKVRGATPWGGPDWEHWNMLLCGLDESRVDYSLVLGPLKRVPHLEAISTIRLRSALNVRLYKAELKVLCAPSRKIRS